MPRGMLPLVVALLIAPATVAAQTVFVSSWGGYGTADGSFHSPMGIDAANGVVYVVDQGGNDRVQVFDDQGAFLGVLGVPGQFDHPAGVAVAGDGTVYVSDLHRVQAFASDGTFLGSWGTLGNGPGEFDHPAGLAVDPGGRLWVADSGNSRLQVFGADGTLVGEVGFPGTGDGAFLGPRDVAIGADGHVFVADTFNHRIEAFDATGTFLVAWGVKDNGDTTWENGEFRFPSGVEVDAAGRVLVSDTEHHRVQVFDANGGFLETWGTRGSGAGQLTFPWGVAADAAGQVFVADQGNWRVDKFQSDSVADPGDGDDGDGDEPGEPAPAVTVQDIQDAVAALVAGGQLHPGRATALSQLLEQAARSLDRGNAAAARGQLGAFVNQVEALVRSRRLASDAGDQLIGLAAAVTADL